MDSDFPGKYGCSCYLSSHPLARFLCLQQTQVGKTLLLSESLFNLAEIADGPSLFASRKDFSQLTVSSIRADGNRRGQPPQKHTETGRAEKGDENNISQSSGGKSSNSKNQEEIIALFRRIQSSISKGDSVNPKVRSSNSSQDNPSAESVLEVLRQSRKQVKGEKTLNKEGNRASTQRRGLLQKDEKVQEYPSAADLKLTRPPSNFVKRSPIPLTSNPRKEFVEQKIEASAATGGEEIEPQKLEEMKLSELKELAKTRGIKGYSKLKKSELVELLRS